jgi:hypothetical protein
MVVSISELFGYIASFFVAISLLMSSFLLLRVLNLIGAIAFVVYGALLGSIPVVITNGFITIIDIYYLVRMLRPDLNGIRYIPIGVEKRHQIEDFVAHHLEDILSFFPEFKTDMLDDVFQRNGEAYLAIRGTSIAGFALVEPVPVPESTNDTELREMYTTIARDLFPDRSRFVPVDYMRKKYRGLGLFRRLYRAIEEHYGGTVEYLIALIPHRARAHRRFLERIDYHLVRESSRFVLLVKDLRADATS